MRTSKENMSISSQVGKPLIPGKMRLVRGGLAQGKKSVREIHLLTKEKNRVQALEQATTTAKLSLGKEEFDSIYIAGCVLQSIIPALRAMAANPTMYEKRGLLQVLEACADLIAGVPECDVEYVFDDLR